MSVEQGLVKLIQGTAAVAAIAPAGGFLTTLPKGQVLPSWTYQFVTATPDLTLCTIGGLIAARVQIDVYAVQGADVVRLGKAIGAVLHGFRGTLPDADATYVDSAFLMDTHDPEFDDASRTWRRVLEFRINYISQGGH